MIHIDTDATYHSLYHTLQDSSTLIILVLSCLAAEHIVKDLGPNVVAHQVEEGDCQFYP